MSGGGGETTQRTIIEQPPPSETELELQRVNLDLAKRQIGQLEDLEAFLAEQEQDPLTQEIRARTLAQLRGEAIPLSPEQQALLDQMFSARREEGFEDISRFTDELAASRGLRTSDTPIGQEGLRQFEKFTRGLQSARAAAELDFGQRERIFQNEAANFSNNLQQQAFLNRLQLANPNPFSVSLASQLAGLRTGATTQTTTGTGGGPGTAGTAFGGISALGGLAGGLGQFGSGFGLGGS